jgi:hypothetical protein
MIEHVIHDKIPRWWYSEQNWFPHGEYYYVNEHCTSRPEGFYFWDETGTQCCGPYKTKDECRKARDTYAQSLEP